MPKFLHLLRSPPDEIVIDLVTAMDSEASTSVVCLYPDGITDQPVDWDLLVEEIMHHDVTICWW